MTPEHFAALRADVVAHLGQRELFVQDLHAGADPAYRLPVRMISEYAWHSLFVRNLFIVPTDDERRSHSPEFTVMCAPTFQATPARHGSRSEVVIALNMAAREVIIAGTSYAGENKKSIFSVLNYVLPLKGVLPMHCSANIGAERRHGAVLRAVGHRQDDAVERSRPRPDRRRRARLERPRRLQLRGRLLRQDDPAVGRGRAADLRHHPPLRHRARERGRRPGHAACSTSTRRRFTENTRAAYPIEFIDNAVPGGQGGHPANIVMLTADAFGVLPPIARLSPEGAMYHFLSGYTAKVAGTEKGVTEPSATFSTCFGAPFLPLNPNVYARMLGERIATPPGAGCGWSTPAGPAARTASAAA